MYFILYIEWSVPQKSTKVLKEFVLFTKTRPVLKAWSAINR